MRIANQRGLLIRRPSLHTQYIATQAGGSGEDPPSEFSDLRAAEKEAGSL